MNQVIISPKEGVKLLLVAVPKDATDFQIGDVNHDEKEVWLSFYQARPLSIGLAYDPLKDFQDYEIIGLASNITKEQAEDFLVHEVYGHTTKYFVYMDYMSENDAFARYEKALQSLIKYSGLTLSEDQDCLILKIN